MDAYDALRKAARDKRDSAIHKARAEYQDTLKAIRSLKAGITGQPQQDYRKHTLPKRRKVIDVICESMPSERLFTAKELWDLVQAECPERPCGRDTIRVLMHTLKDEGVIERVRRDAGNVVWWRKLKDRRDGLAFEAMLLSDASAVVLGDEGPMRMMDLVFRLQARGYRPDANPRGLLRSLDRTLKRNAVRFAVDAERRWGVRPK